MKRSHRRFIATPFTQGSCSPCVHAPADRLCCSMGTRGFQRRQAPMIMLLIGCMQHICPTCSQDAHRASCNTCPSAQAWHTGSCTWRTQRSTRFTHSSHMIRVAVERAHDEDHLDKESDKPQHSEAQRRLRADLGELCVSALTVET
jgi:hypothetical protein